MIMPLITRIYNKNFTSIRIVTFYVKTAACLGTKSNSHIGDARTLHLAYYADNALNQ